MNKIFDSKSFLKTVTNQPGVYRMYDTNHVVIYVGKANNLKKRLSSYFQKHLRSSKIESLVSSIQHIDFTVTNNETEALLLEHNYIKLYQPRYNVFLRDDKSYPFIFLSNDTYPRVGIHRGVKNDKGEYFGPFPNRNAVRKVLSLIQKTFPIRQCKNSIYRNRSRPCLQYQINRCLGPCIKGLVSKDKYSQQVEYVRLFLTGKDNQILTKLISHMEKASISLSFEEAAKIRDQIKVVRRTMEKQFIFDIGNDLDVIGIAWNAGIICIYVLFIRQGKMLGSRSYFPKVPIPINLNEVIENFIAQFYLQGNHVRTLPNEILLNFDLSHKTFLEISFLEKKNHRISIRTKKHDDRACYYLQLANINATASLEARLSQKSTIQKRLHSLSVLFNLPKIQRIEGFDISHTMGEQTVASCVVFDVNGPLHSEYRHYNISNITPGDDYAAINQVLYRRYNREIEERKIPDIILIDGGKGQIHQAEIVFSKLNVSWNKTKPLLLGVAKGNNRRSGSETIFLRSKGKALHLPSDSPALHIIQYIRDESHNYAISFHRKKQAKIKTTSILEKIKGIGPKRRKMLLQYMGGLQGLLNANIEEITKVPGISNILAEKIYRLLKH